MNLDESVARLSVLAAACAKYKGGGPVPAVMLLKYDDGWQATAANTFARGNKSFATPLEAVDAAAKACADILRAWQSTKQQELNAATTDLAAVAKVLLG